MAILSKTSVFGTLTFAAFHFASGNPVLRPRDEHNLPIDKILDPGMNKGKCDNRAWDSSDNSKAVWDSANGWEFVDTFLDKVSKPAGSSDGWAQTLYNSIFPQAGQSQMSCISKEASCSIAEHCDAFEAQGNAGAFYILSSLQNFHTYLSQYEENVETLKVQLHGEVQGIVKQFEFPKEKAGDIKLGEALSGALGIASGLSGAALSVPLAATSALVSILAPKINAVASPEMQDTDDTEIFLKRWIDDATNAMTSEIQLVRNAVFGGWGGNEYTEIPDGFKVPDHGAKHPITSVIGDGRWLLQDPTEGLGKTFADALTHARQSLAFSALRLQYNVVMVINDSDKDKDTCNAMKNNVWDDDAKPAPYCMGMMWLDGNGALMGGINDAAFPLWDVYKMDKLKTYNNIFDCWHKNSGTAGHLDLVNMDTWTGLPRCTFSMEVKKGSWVDDDNDCYSGKTLALDTGFLNFPVASGDYQNKRTHWPQEAPTMSLFCN